MLPQDRRATKPRKRDKKERTKKGDERRKNGLAQRVKPSNPTLAIDALIGEEEQKRKQKEEQNKETGSGFPTQLPWTIWSPLTTHIDHVVGLF